MGFTKIEIERALNHINTYNHKMYMALKPKKLRPDYDPTKDYNKSIKKLWG